MAPPTYIDFDLLIERSGSACKARVLGSPVGEASADFELPFTPEQLEIFVLRAITMGSRRRVRRIQSPDMKEIKRFGSALFDAVFEGEVHSCLRRSLDEADRLDQGLRIRLRLEDAPGAKGVSLLSVPWEFLYDSGGAGFLCLSQQSPLVRYAEIPRKSKPLLVTPPLNVLAMVSSPRDFPELDVEREWEQLDAALAEPIRRGVLSLDRMEDATLENLQQRLRRNTYHIFHFIGHGAFSERSQEGVLLFEQKDGSGDPVGSESLRSLFQSYRNLRMVILNSCEGARASPTDPFAGTAQRLVQGGVLAVIAMQLEITDEAAITFSSEFYAALADGFPVDAALAEARTAVFTRVNAVEWAIPVLYLRSPDGQIFDVSRPTRDEDTATRIDQLQLEASSLLSAGKPARAEKVLGEVLSLAPGDEGAVVLLERAHEQSRVEDQYASAAAQYATGDLTSSLKALRQLVSKGGVRPDIEELVSLIEHELGDSPPSVEAEPAHEARSRPTVSLEQGSLLVDPGGVIATDVIVGNEADSEMTFVLEVVGEAARWASLHPPVLSIPPGATERAEMSFHPPAGPSFGLRAGPKGFAVRVRSESEPALEQSAWGVLGINAVRKIAARLAPGPAGPGVYPHTLSVENLGNVPVTVELKATSAEKSLAVTADPAFMAVGEEETGTAVVVARTKRPLVGGDRTFPFRVEVGGSDIAPVAVEAEVPLKPRAPIWVALVGAVALIALVFIIWRAGLEPDDGSDGGQDARSLLIPSGVIGESPAEVKVSLEVAGFTTEPRSFRYTDCEVPSGMVRQVIVDHDVFPAYPSRNYDGHPLPLYRDNEYVILGGIPGQDGNLAPATTEIPLDAQLHLWISSGLDKHGIPCE